MVWLAIISDGGNTEVMESAIATSKQKRTVKRNESGFRPLLCTYRLNWSRARVQEAVSVSVSMVVVSNWDRDRVWAHLLVQETFSFENSLKLRSEHWNHVKVVLRWMRPSHSHSVTLYSSPPVSLLSCIGPTLICRPTFDYMTQWCNG